MGQSEQVWYSSQIYKLITYITLLSIHVDINSVGVTASAVKENDPLALMREQLLYIPESALTNMITIGEGIPSN